MSRPFFESPQPAGCSDSPFLFLSAIASILRAWLDQCAEDFREPPHFPCLQKLLDYLKRMMPGSDPERRAQNLLEQFHKQEVETDSEYLLAENKLDSDSPASVWKIGSPCTFLLLFF